MPVLGYLGFVSCGSLPPRVMNYFISTDPRRQVSGGVSVGWLVRRPRVHASAFCCPCPVGLERVRSFPHFVTTTLFLPRFLSGAGTPYLARIRGFMTRYSCPSLQCKSIALSIFGWNVFSSWGSSELLPLYDAAFSGSPFAATRRERRQRSSHTRPGPALCDQCDGSPFTSAHTLLAVEQTLTLTRECIFIHVVLP